jgi:hypothetical protein
MKPNMPSQKHMIEECKRQFKELEPAIRRVAMERDGNRPVTVVILDCPDTNAMTGATITWATAEKKFDLMRPADVWARFKRSANQNPRLIPAAILKKVGHQVEGIFDLADPDGPVAEPGQVEMISNLWEWRPALDS